MPPKVRQRDPLTHSDEDLLRIMADDWARSDAHYSDLFVDMRKDWDQFLLIGDDSTDATAGEQGSADPEAGARANFKSGLMRKHLSTSAALIMRSLTLSEKNHAEWLLAKPKSGFAKDDIQVVQNDLEQYRQYRAYILSSEQMNFYDKFEGYVTQGLVFPWSLMLLTHRREGRWVRQEENPEQQMAEDLEARRTRGKKKYDMDEGFEWDGKYIDRPEATIWHTANTRPDPRGGMGLNDCAYLMDEVRVSWYELYENEYDKDTGRGLYFNLNELAEKSPTDDSTKTKEEEMREAQGEQPADGTTTPDDAKDKDSFRNTVVLHRYWTHFGVVISDRDHKIIIGKRRYTKMPLYAFRYSIDWTKFDAQSFARLLRNVDETEDMLTNYRLDNLSFGIDGIPVYNDSAITDESRGKPRHPGRDIKFNGPIAGNFDLFRTNDVTFGILEDRKFNETVATGLGGVSENDSGQMFPGGQRLATEIQAVQTGSANRGGQIVERIEKSILTPFMNDITLLEADRMNSEVEIEIEEKGEFAFPMIDSGFINRMVNKIRFIANGSQFVNQREMEMAGIINFANTFMQNPAVQPFLNIPALLSIAAKRVAHLPDPDVILSDQAKSKTSIPPDMEWVLIQQGYEPQPQYNDNDEQHLEMHQMQEQSAMQLVEQGKIDPAIVGKLQKHMVLHQQKIAQKQQASAAIPGPMAAATPGERNSENTLGTQTASIRNSEPKGVGPPVNQGVTR